MFTSFMAIYLRYDRYRLIEIISTAAAADFIVVTFAILFAIHVKLSHQLTEFRKTSGWLNLSTIMATVRI